MLDGGAMGRVGLALPDRPRVAGRPVHMLLVPTGLRRAETHNRVIAPVIGWDAACTFFDSMALAVYVLFATRDLGIEETGGDVILLLTQDATPADRNWLPALVGAYADPAVDAAWCRQIPRPDCNPLLRRRIEEWMGDRKTLAMQRVPVGQTFAQLEPMAQLRLAAFDNVASSVRRTSWAKYRFGWRLFGEDITFGKRVIENGGCIAFVPEAAVIHSHVTTPEQEGKRVYCDHQNLFALFGLRVIPDLAHCKRAVKDGGAHFLAQVRSEPGLSPQELAELERWAIGYAKWTAWGQYLGANHERLRRTWYGPLMRFVDWWMHRP